MVCIRRKIGVKFNKQYVLSRRWTMLLPAFLVFCAGAAANLRILSNGFVNYDDPLYVSANQQVLKGLTVEGIVWAFTTIYAANWHPLTWISHMLDVQLFGTNPAMHHLISLTIHAVNSTLFFLFFARTTGATGRSLIAALFFSIHPLHVESVAWVSERKEILCALFWLLGMHAYVYYTSLPCIRRYLLVVFLFICALLSKPMAVTFPIVLVLLDFWPLCRMRIRERSLSLGENTRALIIEKIPLLLLSFILGVVTLSAQNAGGAVNTMNAFNSIETALNTAAAIPRYLLKAIWPIHLAVLYPFDPEPIMGVIGIITIVIGSVVACKNRGKPFYLFGWFWFLLILLPVLGVIRIGGHSIADRYMYLPLAGLCVLITWASAEAVSKSPRKCRTLSAFTITIFLLFIVGSWKQSEVWRDSVTLFKHATAVTHANWMAEHQLGKAFMDAGLDKEALPHLLEALRINPRYALTLYNLSVIYGRSGHYDEALSMLEEAVRLAPDDVESRYLLFRLYLESGDKVSAQQQLPVIAEQNPNLAKELARFVVR